MNWLLEFFKRGRFISIVIAFGGMAFIKIIFGGEVNVWWMILSFCLIYLLVELIIYCGKSIISYYKRRKTRKREREKQKYKEKTLENSYWCYFCSLDKRKLELLTQIYNSNNKPLLYSRLIVQKKNPILFSELYTYDFYNIPLYNGYGYTPIRKDFIKDAILITFNPNIFIWLDHYIKTGKIERIEAEVL